MRLSLKSNYEKKKCFLFLHREVELELALFSAFHFHFRTGWRQTGDWVMPLPSMSLLSLPSRHHVYQLFAWKISWIHYKPRCSKLSKHFHVFFWETVVGYRYIFVISSYFCINKPTIWWHTSFENPQRWMGQNTFPILLLNDDNVIEEH